MITFRNLVELFGIDLFSQEFQTFLKSNFEDLTDYNILDSDYIISKEKGIELGFTNSSAVFDDDEQIIFEKGKPIFSHFNIFPISNTVFTDLPFSIVFNDTRETVIVKAGIPIKSREGRIDLLNQGFLVDNYENGNVIYSIDYNPVSTKINFIQARGRNTSNVSI